MFVKFYQITLNQLPIKPIAMHNKILKLIGYNKRGRFRALTSGTWMLLTENVGTELIVELVLK